MHCSWASLGFTQDITTRAFARQHALSLANLYRWQRKLQLESVPYSVGVATPDPKSKFIALRASDVVPECYTVPRPLT
jgi:hypothetical protein